MLAKARKWKSIVLSYQIQFNERIVNVVVQFCFWFNLDFPLFFSMLIYDNEYQTVVVGVI